MPVLLEDPANKVWSALHKDTIKDPQYHDLAYYLVYGNPPVSEPFLSHPSRQIHLTWKSRNFYIHQKRLYHRTRNGGVVCVTQAQVPEVLFKAHDCNHYAIRSTLKSVSDIAWWPECRSNVIQDVLSCLKCTSYGPIVKRKPLHPILIHQVFHLLGLDYIGPLPETPDGNKYILHTIDYFSWIRRTWFLPSATEVATIRCWKDFFNTYVNPVAVYSDNRSHFSYRVTA